MFEAAGAFRGGQGLRDERLAVAGAAPVADPPQADAEVVVTSHGAAKRDVQSSLTLLGF
jgi:hypothetical protein